MTRGYQNEETSQEQVSLHRKPHNCTKNSDLEWHALTATYVFLLFSRHNKTQLWRKIATRKTHNAKTQMPTSAKLKGKNNCSNVVRNSFENTSKGMQLVPSPTNLWTRWWQQWKKFPWERKITLWLLVYNMHIHNMHQDQDKTICSFGARLQGQASVCKIPHQMPRLQYRHTGKLHQEHPPWRCNMRACRQQKCNKTFLARKNKTWH